MTRPVFGMRAVMATPEVMNLQTCAAYLGVAEDTLYKYANEGKLPCFRLGNRWRFKKSLIDKWMESESTYGAKQSD